MVSPKIRSLSLLSFVAAAPMICAPEGACEAINSQTPAPDVEGTWDIVYDDTVDVEVEIGGATYTAELGIEGGTITIDHDGQPFSFDLDCNREGVICPSEVFPASVRLEQRYELFQHRMYAMLPTQGCSGTTTTPGWGECGWGTENPDCDEICDGEIVAAEEERFGVINEEGTGFELYLGAGITTNGVNCALVGGSIAEADLDTIGSGETNDWEAVSMSNGVITTVYAGGCLWVVDPEVDSDTEALVIAASVTFTTGFQGTRR